MNSRKNLVAVVLATVLSGAQVPLGASPSDVCLITNTPLRCAVWRSFFDDAAEEEGTSLALSPNGDRVYAGAFNWGLGQYGAVVAYASSDGQELWRHILPAPVWDVAADPMGRYVFAASRRYPQDHLVAVNASTGEEEWRATAEGAAGNNFVNRAAHVQVSPDSAVVYLGRTVAVDGSHSDFGIEAYDTQTGELLWTGRYSEGDLVSDVAVSPDGSMIYVTGISGESNGWTTVAVRSGDGLLQWVTEHHSGGLSFPWGIAVSPDGDDLAITGREGTYWDLFRTVALDARTGDTRWSQSNEGPLLENVFNEGHAVVFSPDGSKVFATGTSGGNILVTIAYNAESGDELWAVADGNYLGGYPYAIDTSLDGERVYVTGSVSGSLQTRAYHAGLGAIEWVGLHVTEGGGTGYDLVVGPDDRVYVTGRGDFRMVTSVFEG